jgi:ATP-dependent protease ClpP protease subunit
MTTPNRNVFYVTFLDAINDAKAKAVMSMFTEILAKHKPDTVYCLFSSSGGFVDPGIALYNFLRSLPIELIMHNIGSVDSTANAVFLAGEKRYAATHSSFLFHGIKWTFNANVSLTRSQMIETLSGLSTAEAKICGVVTERTQLVRTEIEDLFRQGESKDPAFALSKGIVHEIKNPSIPKDAPMFSFNLQ